MGSHVVLTGLDVQKGSLPMLQSPELGAGVAVTSGGT